jgi:hypothetical protein
MKPLAPDEKIATVMVYTQNMLARGDVITKESVRVSIWLRTQGVPNYVHIYKPQIIMFGSTPPKSFALSEIFIPTPQVIGFHLAPPAQDPIDYDATESNRTMQPIELLLASFTMKAKIRISTQTDISTSLDVMRVAWVSVYDADISNPYLPQFSMQVPMLLVNPNQVSVGLME